MSHRIDSKELPNVDVELVLEGSYPYVTGGVSSWTQRLIEGLPEITFGIVHLAAKPEDTKEMKYKMPDNILYVHNIFLHDPVFLEDKKLKEKYGMDENKFFNGMFNLHMHARDRQSGDFKSIIEKLCSECAIPHMRDFFYSEKAFSLLLALYKKGFENSSFIDFFWTWRYMHIPLFQIFQARKGKARIVHAACTGYAGFYAATRRIVDNIPLVLTEHGIYTRERAIDIIRSEAMEVEKSADTEIKLDYGVFKRIWLSFFEVLGLWTYQMSDAIITLYEGNRQSQVLLGADFNQIQIIPNGIEIEKYLELRSDSTPDPESIQVGYVGRIVSIKDLKTLLRAFKLVLLTSPGSTLHLVGPEDEEIEYTQAMKRVAHDLAISDRVIFYGTQDVRKFYPKLDVCVLTSISEGQPLILLEAMAAGIPVVATDVGGCAELLNGRTTDDRRLGPCGITTNVAAPAETSQAILSICRNEGRFTAFRKAGIERAKKFYQQKKVLESYRNIYLRWLSQAGKE